MPLAGRASGGFIGEYQQIGLLMPHGAGQTEGGIKAGLRGLTGPLLKLILQLA